ncbi:MULTISPECIES: methyltransferase domain-containing protein [unclassified Shewanella]|uniref:methyltransferase domain-containing protein n=1 Tax=unclassified Shewanella TaxID=196818 RepID=UPI001BC4C143|nr:MULTISPECIES: methyltransferase domain-containing protein [unclassified Shewanella]GIU18909.1 hypothetical protein TUM4444_34490 [Shewanella sp. MBTL60-112-B1]GIU40442.1 hypothetical protein TUM4445_39580 [Shewanella sp. MBTL60-112-B2]
MHRVLSTKNRIKKILKKSMLINSVARYVYFTLIEPFKTFTSSGDYWNNRYETGGDSGPGSYDQFAIFKAGILNEFVKDNRVQTVIEFGCGDGNQLVLSQYPTYLGFDISRDAIQLCWEKFHHDNYKKFMLLNDYKNETADLAISLDVIYHLVEEDTYEDYMHRLFNSATRFVIIYSSNTDVQLKLQAKHVRHRQFSDWVELNTQWVLKRYIPNQYPYSGDEQEGTISDFYIYENTLSTSRNLQLTLN